MKISKFLILQLVSCVVWAVLFAALGYWVGASCDALIKNIERVLLIILFLGMAFAFGGRKFFEYWFRRPR